jgi:hypothetical protein
MVAAAAAVATKSVGLLKNPNNTGTGAILARGAFLFREESPRC